MASSLFNPRALQSFSTISLQIFFSLPLGLPLHTPCISSPNHYLLFGTHAHTIATCFAVVQRLYHLILVSLSTLYLEQHTALHNLPLTVSDISLLVSNGTNYLNLFHPIRIPVSTAASSSPSTLNMSPK